MRHSRGYNGLRAGSLHVSGRCVLYPLHLHVSLSCHSSCSSCHSWRILGCILLVAVLRLSVSPPVLTFPCQTWTTTLGGGPIGVCRLIGLCAVMVWRSQYRLWISIAVLRICTLRLLLLRLLLLLLLLLCHGHCSSMLLHIDDTSPSLILPARKPALLLVHQTHGSLDVLPVVILDIDTASEDQRVIVAC